MHLLVYILAGLFAWGCAANPATSLVALFKTPHDVQADWDDTDAAVEVGLSQVQMALDHEEKGQGDQDTEHRYYLLTQTDEPALLILRRDKAIFDGTQTITLEAHVGRFGDQAREARLIRAVRHRLKSLVGVSHAPITLPSSS